MANLSITTSPAVSLTIDDIPPIAINITPENITLQLDQMQGPSGPQGIQGVPGSGIVSGNLTVPGTASIAGAVTLSAGTVNGVAYLNASKVLTTGTGLTYDGNLLIGTTTNTNTSKLVVNGSISETVSGVQYQVVSQADIGTAANEIPLNQYLGDLAYMNSESVVISPQSSAAPAGIGDMVFQLNSNTSLVIKVKGSDGAIRSATLTLT